jgi:hypothetical protein
MLSHLLLSVFYVCLFDVPLHEDDLREIETCRSISGLYVHVCTLNICAFVGIIY